MPKQYWLMKSEPDDVSFDDVLASKNQTTSWYGVRNYQARNFIRDAMQVGDGVLFYHSSCAVPGIAGIAEIASTPYPDATQFDPASPYYDAKATQESPRWTGIDVRAVKQGRYVELKELRSHPELENMRLLAKGSRLSVMPVEADEWRFILKLIG
ncbi:EVE domain-containing protein [Pseudoduganella sp. SL102]|uniref:EVE domain-containing protein n=1 Tax=Pseudoduganella sp. SL102 TaxID=2995154 RepID=UPI00248C7CE3|nr:EVE domain-containing protein [Pseudoduganella sp. SL102]WBS01915.1 EVE domain-containing protein [Pseudoduganella sp. SL102]